MMNISKITIRFSSCKPIANAKTFDRTMSWTQLTREAKGGLLFGDCDRCSFVVFIRYGEVEIPFYFWLLVQNHTFLLLLLKTLLLDGEWQYYTVIVPYKSILHVNYYFALIKSQNQWGMDRIHKKCIFVFLVRFFFVLVLIRRLFVHAQSPLHIHTP